jgi:hypothetical protein
MLASFNSFSVKSHFYALFYAALALPQRLREGDAIFAVMR